MAFEIGGTLRPWIVAWIVAWPSSSPAQPPTSTEPFHPVSYEAAPPESFRLKAVSFGGWSLGKRGVEYRNSFVIKRQELSYRIWGGRAHKKPAIGVDVEPTLRRNKLRVGAFGSASEIGIAVRLRY